jgi:transposase
MSQNQLTRFAVLTKLIDGHITVKQAAESLDLSERQIKRLKKGVMQDGAAFLKHKNSDRKPQHAF